MQLLLLLLVFLLGCAPRTIGKKIRFKDCVVVERTDNIKTCECDIAYIQLDAQTGESVVQCKGR